MKYYFLTDKNQTFVIGPFINVIDTSEKYFGQIIRSNDYSDFLTNSPFEYKFWFINLNESNLVRVKYLLHENLSKFSSNPNITYIGTFQGSISPSNKKLELIDHSNIKYILEFRINETILYCPNLTIEF
jgi:hypothetical protein